MSPRAAWRLETLGFDSYDYVAGKQDWLAFGLAYEGEAQLAGALTNPEVATCALDDCLEDVADRLRDSRLGMGLVLNAAGVVLGRVGAQALDGEDAGRVADVMVEGPTTVRPSEPVEALTQRMRRAGVDGMVVTRSNGTLVGVFERDRGEQALADTATTDETTDEEDGDADR